MRRAYFLTTHISRGWAGEVPAASKTRESLLEVSMESKALPIDGLCVLRTGGAPRNRTGYRFLYRSFPPLGQTQNHHTVVRCTDGRIPDPGRYRFSA